MSLTRLEGWESRLAAYIDAARSQAFVWGGFDCCTMPFDVVAGITGVDPWAAFRGEYETELGALRILKNFSGGGVVEMAEQITADLGAPEVSQSFARRGDLGLMLESDVPRSVAEGEVDYDARLRGRETADSPSTWSPTWLSSGARPRARVYMVGGYTGFGGSLGICLGGSAAVVTPEGMRFVRKSSMSRIWQMG